jgi:hypothetical protein
MSTSAPALRRPLSAASTRTLLLGAGGVAIAVAVGVSGAHSAHTYVRDVVPVVLVPLVVWLFVSERYALTLSVLLLYLGLIDGVVKLASGSNVATLGRDLLLYAIVAGVVVRAVLGKRRVPLPPFTGLVLLWVAVCVMQVANPEDVSVAHAIAALRQHLEFVPLFFFGFAVMRSERRFMWFFILLVVIAAINGVVSLIQSGMSPSELASWGPGYHSLELGGGPQGVSRTYVVNGVSKVRPPALGGEDGFGGLVAMIALPGLLAVLGMRNRGLKWGWLLIPGAVLLVIGLATSQTRLDVVGSVIALFAFLALTITSRRGASMLIIGVLFGALAWTVASGAVASGQSRYASIAPSHFFSTISQQRGHTLGQIPSYFTEFPLGAGLGSVGAAGGSTFGGAAKPGLNGESEFTFLEVETGIPGLLVMIVFTLTILRAGLSLRRVADPDLQRSFMAITGVFLACAAAWVIGPVTATSPTAPFIWFAGGTIAYWYGEMRAGRLKLRTQQVKAALAAR